MRYLFTLFLISCSCCAYGQTKFPLMQRYHEKYYFVDTFPFKSANWSAVADTAGKAAGIARSQGDLELANLFELLLLKRQNSLRLINADTVELKLLELAADARRSNNRYLEADVLHELGNFYAGNNQKQSAAVEHYVEAYSLYKNFTSEEYPAKQNNTYALGGMYYRYEDYDNAIRYLQEAAHLKQATNNNIFCSIFNTIGMAYRQTKRYDSAIFYYRQSYDNAVRLRDEAWMGIAQGNIGITYFHQKKYEEAIPLLKKDIEVSLATVNIKNAIGSMNILATIYNEQHQYDEALMLILKARTLSLNRQFWPDYQLATDMYTQLFKAYNAKGNFRLASLYADSALVARDSAGKRNNILALSKAHEKENYITHKLEAEKLRNDIRIGMLELAKQRIEMTFTFIGIAILLVVIMFIARERKRSENLLLNILPEKIAERLKRKEHPIADYFDNASILFIDMAGFTVFSDGRDPKEIVNILNHVFTAFDNIAEKYGLEKIKTIGDCYMAVSGLPEPRTDHAEAATLMALEVREQIKEFTAPDGTPLVFRIGLDCGPVVAGVIGRRKFIYDLWGDTVNTASRMESSGVAGQVHCSDRFKKIIEHNHKFASRGLTDIKGKGVMETWLILE